jgi:Protein of unknown function (DUF3499)
MDVPVSVRRCARSACARAAVVSLSFDYGARTVWLDQDVAPHPSRYDLCRAHVARLRVPHGWQLVDRRRATAVAIPAPAAG